MNPTEGRRPPEGFAEVEPIAVAPLGFEEGPQGVCEQNFDSEDTFIVRHLPVLS